MLEVKVKILRQGVELPKYQTSGSAALDLVCAAEEPMVIPAGGRATVPTGIAIEPSEGGVVALLCARSGLASKQGIALSNGVGVIDSDYRGEICAAMVNLSDKDYKINPGDRIAQLMFLPVLQAKLIPSEELSDTTRGAGGFGSTGV